MSVAMLKIPCLRKAASITGNEGSCDRFALRSICCEDRVGLV
jgi:hypothetical protein